MRGDDQPYSLKTVSRAFDLLRSLGDAARPQTLSQIAGATGMSTSNAFRFLKSLEASGHIRRDAAKRYTVIQNGGGEIGLTRGIALCDRIARSGGGCTLDELAGWLDLDQPQVARALEKLVKADVLDSVNGHWRISTAMLRFLHPILNDQFVERFIGPILDEFSLRTQETVSWYVLHGQDQVVVSVRPSTHPLRFVLESGASYPLCLGAAGKAQLAAMSESAVTAYLTGLEPQQRTGFRVDKARLAAEIALTRRRGYALSEGERVEGAVSVACGVCDPLGAPKGVISVMMPGFRMVPGGLDELGHALRARIDGLYRPPDPKPEGASQ